MIDKTFAGLLEYFVITYAKKEAGFSGETLRSYYAAVEQYIFWLKENEHISIDCMDVSHFSKERIKLFLLHLETEQEVSISTRNLRRAGIVAFLAFASEICPVYSKVYFEAQKIKIKKAPKPKKDFLTIEEFKAILECIDISKRNGLFLGTPGSGKSFSAKREIVNVFLMTEDDIIISDPEGEYHPIVSRLGGQVIKLSPVSTQYVNPMEINPDYADEEDPLTLKSDFILSLCELNGTRVQIR